MKKIIICTMLLILTGESFSQKTLTREDYLKKSKNQKTVGWVLIAIGGLVALGSIPFFIASSRNKRKANAAIGFLKMETVPVIQQTGFTARSYPALAVKIGIH